MKDFEQKRNLINRYINKLEQASRGQNDIVYHKIKNTITLILLFGSALIGVHFGIVRSAE